MGLGRVKTLPYNSIKIARMHLHPGVPVYFSSSGIKSRVMDFRLVRSWVYLTPAESLIRLEAMVARESAYLSDR